MADLEWQSWLTLAMVLTTLALLLWERISPDKVLVGAVAVLIVSGVLTHRRHWPGSGTQACSPSRCCSFWSQHSKSTGAIRWIDDLALGRPPGILQAQARTLGIAASLSAFINNTPIVAMLTSMIESWSRRSGIAPSRLLLPMNYAAILGGMCTLVGTSTNLVVAGLVLQAGMPPLHMFTPFVVGTAAALAGILYLLVFRRRLLPERRSALQQAAAETREYVVEMLVESGGPIAGKTIHQARLWHLAGSYHWSLCANAGSTRSSARRCAWRVATG